MSLNAAQFVGLAREQLTLCGVTAGTDVMLYTDPESRAELHAACMAACVSLDARPFSVVVPSLGSMRADAPASVLAAATSVEVLLDISGRGMLHSEMQTRVLESGARILRAREPLEVLARMAGSTEVRARVEAGANALQDASTMRVTSPSGTDITFHLADRAVTTQYGFTDEPGRWDHWGTALVATAPDESKGTGQIVLAPGDIYFLSATRGVTIAESVTIELRDGAIEKIGGGPDAARIGETLDADRFGVDARKVSHIGWGCDPRAQWDALVRYGHLGGGGADIRSVAGGVVLAFGANADLGGANQTLAHMDLALRDCTVEVDGVAVVEDGGLTA